MTAVVGHHSTPHKPVPAPRVGARQHPDTANDNQPLTSPRKWKEVWGPTILVLGVNLAILVVPAAFAIGALFERMNNLQTHVSRLETTTESVRQQVGELQVSFGRVDERLSNLQQSTDRLTTAVDTYNGTLNRLAADDK